MKNIIDGRGFLTEDGKNISQAFQKEVDALLNLAANEQELRLIGSVLSSLIGTKVANKISK